MTITKKFATTLVAMAMIFSLLVGNNTIFASAEIANDNANTTISSALSTDDAQALRNKLDASIGLEPSRNYSTDYWGSVTFTGSNTGSWHTINGNYIRVCYAIKPVDGIPYSISTYYRLEQYPGTTVNQWYRYPGADCSPDADGYYFYVSEWFNINSCDHRLYYTAVSAGSSTPRRVNCHVWIDYQ